MAEETPDNPDKDDIPPPPQTEKVFSEDLDAFKDALESLYMSGNLSGRNHFRTAWPHAGAFMFDPALNEYDMDGTGNAEDREQRAALEQAAEDKQNALLGQIIDAQESSVHGGMLNLEYVEKTIQSLQRDLASYVYAAHLVDKFLPAGQDVPDGQSGLNLGEKKNIVQVDFKISDPISYHDLVKNAEENQPEEAPEKPSYSIRHVFNSSAALSVAGKAQ